MNAQRARDSTNGDAGLLLPSRPLGAASGAAGHSGLTGHPDRARTLISLPTAGALLVIGSAAVLLGWAVGVPELKSLVPGWRVMVPSSAFSLMLIGLSLDAGIGREQRWRRIVARVFGLAALVLPLMTLVEYVTASRLHVEQWLGFDFPSGPNDVEGRMSPVASLSLASLSVAATVFTLSSRAAVRVSLVMASTTLVVSWIGLLVMAFDTERLLDAARFPGLAAPTLLLLAIASGALLDAAIVRSGARERGARDGVRRSVIVSMFLLPLLASWVRSALEHSGTFEEGLVVAVSVFVLAATAASVFWSAAERVVELESARAQAVADLEDRVDERTRALAEANAHLSAGNRRKDDFLATLAHELRNPLAPIRNAVSVLALDAVPAAQQRTARDIIARQVDHMVRLIDDLLDVSRITTGRFRIQEEHVRLDQILTRAMEMTQPSVQRFRHEVTLDLPPEPVWLHGDGARLTQVFANLAHNACKYMDPGGVIEVRGEIREGWVEVAVRDRGIGIPPEFQPYVFDKFAQEAPARERSDGGLGLGLSLVRGIIDLHGGTVTVSSSGRAGEGSVFVVRLPVAEAPDRADVPAAPHPQSAAHRSGTRILVVDDNRDGADSLAALLARHGHDVSVAYDGESALTACEAVPPDVLLLDIGLPGMDGYELCRAVRRTSWGARALIVAQTGWGQHTDLALANRAGFDSHFVKPVDSEALQALIVRSRLFSASTILTGSTSTGDQAEHTHAG